MTAAAAPIPAGVALERRVVRRFLRLPLLAKLAGANALIVIGALLAAFVDHRSRGEDYRLLILLGAALLAGLVVNATLVMIALRPIRELEQTASRFWKGDLAARVPWSAVADRDIEKLSDTLNLLLESNEQERQRVRALTEGVLRYEDNERVDVARILHESQAQSLTGLMYCLTAALSECDNESCRRHVEDARSIAQRGVEELRDLSSRVHPTLLDDFGLIAAIRQVARAIEKDNAHLSVQVRHEEVQSMQHVSPSDKSVLYRATEEALRSAVAHGATRVGITIRADAGEVGVDVEDNGAAAEPGMGLAVTTRLWLMRERLAFIGGTCVMRSDPSGGARVSMRLPLKNTIIEAMPTAMMPEPHAA
jgi:signal transduction histidine kinase